MPPRPVHARLGYLYQQLTELKPRQRDEARAVLAFLFAHQRIAQQQHQQDGQRWITQAEGILHNLLWITRHPTFEI